MEAQSMTLLQLQQRITALVTVAATRDVWVTGELMDVSVRNHCYLEIVQKDDSGATVARARAVVWASTFRGLRAKFRAATGQDFATGLKVMARVSVSNHPVYGLSLVISDVNPDYTMGDLLRRRREILERLQREGILEQNRRLAWPDVPQRIAVISSPKAAGYGDFISQLLRNPRHLRFDVKLFDAVMQGDRAPATILAALEAVATDAAAWDCVVIIRGGGATADLAAFESYDLAAAIAMFELPVIVGIGHERDITVLDYVANMRVKTPTAAAEFLIGRGGAALDRLQAIATEIASLARGQISAAAQQLSYCEGLLPVLPPSIIERRRNTLTRMAGALGQVAARTSAQHAMLDARQAALANALSNIIARQSTRLDSLAGILDAISPEATLRRGYSITRRDGHAVTDASTLDPGDIIETVFAKGKKTSTVN